MHICGRRYVNRDEAVTEIKVYSNQDTVTLSWTAGERDEDRGQDLQV